MSSDTGKWSPILPPTSNYELSLTLVNDLPYFHLPPTMSSLWHWYMISHTATYLQLGALSDTGKWSPIQPPTSNYELSLTLVNDLPFCLLPPTMDSVWLTLLNDLYCPLHHCLRAITFYLQLVLHQPIISNYNRLLTKSLTRLQNYIYVKIILLEIRSLTWLQNCIYVKNCSAWHKIVHRYYWSVWLSLQSYLRCCGRWYSALGWVWMATLAVSQCSVCLLPGRSSQLLCCCWWKDCPLSYTPCVSTGKSLMATIGKILDTLNIGFPTLGNQIILCV